MHAFFISNVFINNTRLKLAKNWAKAKQHHEAELLTGRKQNMPKKKTKTKAKSKNKNKKIIIRLIVFMINYTEIENNNEK